MLLQQLEVFVVADDRLAEQAQGEFLVVFLEEGVRVDDALLAGRLVDAGDHRVEREGQVVDPQQGEVLEDRFELLIVLEFILEDAGEQAAVRFEGILLRGHVIQIIVLRDHRIVHVAHEGLVFAPAQSALGADAAELRIVGQQGREAVAHELVVRVGFRLGGMELAQPGGNLLFGDPHQRTRDVQHEIIEVPDLVARLQKGLLGSIHIVGFRPYECKERLEYLYTDQSA